MWGLALADILPQSSTYATVPVTCTWLGDFTQAQQQADLLDIVHACKLTGQAGMAGLHIAG